MPNKKTRKNFYKKMVKYDLYGEYMEIETWKRWYLSSIRLNRNNGLPTLTLIAYDTKEKRDIILEKLSDYFKPIIK